jgi:hypothetical protein
MPPCHVPAALPRSAPRTGRFGALLAAVAATVMPLPGQALTATWQCAAGTWLNAACWSPAAVPSTSTFGDLIVVGPVAGQRSTLVIGRDVNALLPFTQLSNNALIWQTGGTLQTGAQHIGVLGTGYTQQDGGTNAVSELLLGRGSVTSQGSYTLSGGTLGTRYESIGVTGTGRFTQTGGSHTTQLLTLGSTAGATGVYAMAGGNLFAMDATVNRGSSVIQTGGIVSAAILEVTGSYTLYAGSLLADNWRISSGGTFLMTSGTQLNAHATAVSDGATFAQTGGVHTVSNGNFIVGEGSTYALSGGTLFAQGGTATNRGTFKHSGGTFSSMVISNKASYLQTGGHVETAEFDNEGSYSHTGGTFTGRFINKGLLSLGGDFAPSLGLDNQGTVQGQGTISGAFSNAGVLLVDSGGLTITQAFRNTGLIKLMGTAATPAQLQGGAIENTGLIQGSGMVANTVHNQASIEALGGTLRLSGAGNTNQGDLRAQHGEQLIFSSGLARNDGRITVIGGSIFDNGGHSLLNAANISLSGVLRASSLGNSGLLAFEPGGSTVVGAVRNLATGTLLVTSGAQAHFLSVVSNQGSLLVGSGGIAEFQGRFSGSGSLAGEGQVRFLGGFAPGNSPAALRVDVQSSFGADSEISMELGGLSAGDCDSCFDKLSFSKAVTLEGGKLSVLWWGGFKGESGNVFDLFDWDGGLSGHFAQLDLPTLAAGLAWQTDKLYTTGELRISAVPEPASNALIAASLLLITALRTTRRQQHADTQAPRTTQ